MNTPRTGPASPSGAPRDARRQQGAALLMAMIILTLVATLAAGMVWQQSTSVAIETAERARAQSAWILNGGFDWSRMLLKEDARGSSADNLAEIWATPLAEARLSSFLAADKDNNSDGDLEAFLSGSMEDAQSRYNLKRLSLAAVNGKDEELQTLRQLFSLIDLPPQLADTLAENLRAAWTANGTAASSPATNVPADNAALAPQNIAQLSWLGLDEASIQRMRPYVTLLPDVTAVNINTAPREVIAAVVNGLALGGADRLVQRRTSKPFETMSEAEAQEPKLNGMTGRIDVKSSFFEVKARFRLGDLVQEEVALMQRQQNAVTAVWRIRSQPVKGQ